MDKGIIRLPLIIQSRMTTRDAVFYALLIVGTVLAFFLGVWGLIRWYPSQGNIKDLTAGYAIYWTLRLFVLESGEIAGLVPWQLDVARFLAPFVMLTTALKLTSEFAKEFWQEMRAKKGGHILLIGDHALMPCLAKGFHKVYSVVMLRWGENATYGLELKPWRFKEWVFRGDNQNKKSLGYKVLQRAHLAQAAHGVILHQDSSVALDVLRESICILKDAAGSVTSLHMHFDDAAALVVARRMVDEAQLPHQIYLTNLYEVAARELVMRFPPENSRSLQEPVRVAIVGAGALGRALCVQMGFSGHFACLKKTQVTLLDTNLERLADGEQMLRLSYTQLNECLDFSCVPEHPLRYFAQWDAQSWRGVAQIWVCLDDEVECSALVDSLQLLARRSLGGGPGEPQVLNRLAMVKELLTDTEVLLRDKQSIDPMAAATHENYRKRFKPEGQLDYPWERLARNYREANRRSAEHLWVKLRALGWAQPFPLLPSRSQVEKMIQGNEELLSRMEKNRWNADRYLNGWVYGPVRDNERKIHNLLVAWEDLDVLQQSKDTSNVELIADLVEG